MNIYVGNLSSEVTEDDLRREFIIFGEVTHVSLMNDRSIGSGQRRGCGYVEMPIVLEGELAIARLQGTLLKGLKIDIIKSLPITHNTGGKIGDTQISGFDRKARYWGVRRPRAT
jgi:RNA recognition motif-containing protein